MSRAEKHAVDYLTEHHSPSDVSDFQAAMNIAVLKAYVAGYREAEKENALIPEDMGVIFNLVRKLQYKYGGDYQGCLEEALELFNKAKNGQGKDD